MFMNADCHIMEPDDLFTRHLSDTEKFQAPIFQRLPDGTKSCSPTVFRVRSPRNTLGPRKAAKNTSAPTTSRDTWPARGSPTWR